MKFLMTYTGDPNLPPSTPEKMAAIVTYADKMTKSGVLVMTGGIVRPTKGTKVRLAAGKFAVTDGPFPETKELIDGFAILEVKSEEEAIAHASDFMKIAGDGKGEILRIFDPSEGPH